MSKKSAKDKNKYIWSRGRGKESIIEKNIPKTLEGYSHNEIQELVDLYVTLSLGICTLNITKNKFSLGLDKLYIKMRNLGYSQKKINYMVTKASNRYKLGDEVYRICKKIKV